MKKNIIYLFIALITLLLVGCGGSSPDNPLSSNVNSGLVNISGNVKNSTGNGSVSFYAPTAAAKNCLNVTNSFRASVANEGIYRFNTDENGNYSGQIPAGDYYIIAQNSDGTMKYVSSKQSFNSSRATTEVKQDITLNKTVNISGKIVPSDYVSFSNNDFSSIPLYIEGYPFMAVTDLEGKFEFSSVPCLTEADSEANSYYTIKSTINLDGIVFFATEVLSYTNFTNGTYKNLELAFVLDEDEVLKEYKTINGKVYNNNGANKEPVGNHLVVGVLSSGQIKYGLTDEEGKFSLIIKANETFADISADLHTFTHITEFTSVIEDKFENLLYTDSGSGSGSSAPIFHSILFTEPPSEGLKANGEAILTIYKKTSNNKYVFYKEEISKRIKVYDNHYLFIIGKPKTIIVGSKINKNDLELVKRIAKESKILVRHAVLNNKRFEIKCL